MKQYHTYWNKTRSPYSCLLICTFIILKKLKYKGIQIYLILKLFQIKKLTLVTRPCPIHKPLKLVKDSKKIDKFSFLLIFVFEDKKTVIKTI